MDDILSPLTSGMSLKKAMTTEKRHIMAVTKIRETGSAGSLTRLCQAVTHRSARTHARTRGGTDALVQHVNGRVQVEAELYDKGADDQDASGGQDGGPLPPHAGQVHGVHDAQRHAGSPNAHPQAGKTQQVTSSRPAARGTHLIKSAHMSGGDDAMRPGQCTRLSD